MGEHMTDDELTRLESLRDALRKSEMVGGPIPYPGNRVDITIAMSRETLPLLMWAVSDSPEGVEREPLGRETMMERRE